MISYTLNPLYWNKDNINVKNISKVCTGVKKVELNGIEVENKILLDGSGKVYNIEVKM